MIFLEHWCCVLLFTVRYASNPLIVRNHFGYAGSVDPNLPFSLRKTVLAFIGTNEERKANLTKGAASMSWELISYGSIMTVTYSGNQGSFLEMPSKRMKRFCLTGTTSGTVKLRSTASSSLTWNGCFHCYIYSPCLFPGTWTGILPERVGHCNRGDL